MNKFFGILLIITGAVLVIISIFALIKSFDAFVVMGGGTENIAYVIGSIVFPLLLTVFGRWVIRKGFTLLRK